MYLRIGTYDTLHTDKDMYGMYSDEKVDKSPAPAPIQLCALPTAVRLSVERLEGSNRTIAEATALE